MRALYDQHCTTCGFTMMYVQRRGSSGGTWVCPTCGRVRSLRMNDKEETREQSDDNTNDSYEDAA